MSAPDRIWIDGAVNANVWAEQKTDCTLSGVAAYEYVRADLRAPMQDERVQALVEAVQFARNRLEVIASESWNGDARDFKRSIVGVFADVEAALRALEQGNPEPSGRPPRVRNVIT